ncbi:MAG: aminoglycoside phosphotransferase family protein [Bacilli bacterium]|nr:aminoglycoside phosphotransferase family protein [Bacilli bacterium]
MEDIIIIKNKNSNLEISEQPQKWRDTIDPYSIPLKTITILKVLGYPHAANDVFYLKVLHKSQEKLCFLKYKRHKDANIENEIKIINSLNLKDIPTIIEYADDYSYVVTEEIRGLRLSKIVGNNKGLESSSYMHDYGKRLGLLHKQEGILNFAPSRDFHEIPDKLHFKEINLMFVYNWLVKNKPNYVNKCFVHGDFHYANILWDKQKINGILDFELAGIGNKEFDIAWSVILRPSQKFLYAKKEVVEFLNGYQSVNVCEEKLVVYYMALIYSRFYNNGDGDYKDYIIQWYKNNLDY